MSKIKISPNVFLEVAELRRFQKTLADWGYKRDFLLSTKTFGLVRDINLPDLGLIPTANCFEVTKAGTPIDEIVVNKGIAVDANGDLIINKTPINLQVLNNGQFFWVKIAHIYSNEEEGTIDIDSTGNCTGNNTFFTDVLRGGSNYPSKIVFLNSNNNNNIYEVVRILNGQAIILSGDFIPETGLKYAVVGTFTPGYVVPFTDRNIFDYDSCNITLEPETVLNTPPAKINDMEFYVARVSFNGTDLIIEDKRNEYWNGLAGYNLSNINRNVVNPVIGVEAIKWDINSSPKFQNEISIAWGFRSVSYTIDPTAKKISILAGNGGTYKDTSNFSTGDFDGWRLYSKDGKFKNIIASVKTGTQIVITLDNLDIDDYPANEEIVIVPPVEAIEIKIKEDSSATDLQKQLELSYEFPIFASIGKIYARVPFDLYKYNITFRYRVFEDYTDWFKFADDAVGYYDETSFEVDGTIKPNVIDRNQKPYTADLTVGFIELIENTNSYKNFVKKIDTGDLFGVNMTALDNSTPVVDLKVGTDRQYQFYDHPSGIAFGSNFYINLKKADILGNPYRNGNFFLLQFRKNITQGAFNLRIVQDYVSNTSFTLLYQFNADDFNFINNYSPEGIFIRCTFNGTNWIVNFTNESKIAQAQTQLVPSGAIIEYPDAAAPAGWLVLDGSPVSRTGATANLFAICGLKFGPGDGSTTFNLPNCQNRVTIGYAVSSGSTGYVSGNGVVGTTGGENEHKLLEAETPLPNHLHGPGTLEGYTDTDNWTQPDHQHTIESGDGGSASYYQRAFTNNGAHITYNTGPAGGFTHNHNHHFLVLLGATAAQGIKDTSEGGSVTITAHNNRQPFIVLNKIIKI